MLKRVFISDCEGPISKNDNAYELTARFVPDGDKLFAVISKYDDVLADVLKKPSYNAGDTLKLILPFLKDLEYDDTRTPMRWWPRGMERQIVIDPQRNFGQPCLTGVGIPTRTLANSVKANGSPEEVARWFEVSVEAVQEAVDFEQYLERPLAA